MWVCEPLCDVRTYPDDAGRAEGDRAHRHAVRMRAHRHRVAHLADRKFSTSSEGARLMIIMMPEHRVKRAAKRLQKVLRELGIEFRHIKCLELAARLCGFDNWSH